ncbi:cupin [Desulfuromonas versatilis]|uniref:Cupin n=1 Tax=Desulfuromonas versatilis TaxID=2802975 RepID=A0ABM8HME6_9BACT|nr:cupin domain-containing protein [Desulfuromonas versatilis]BCR03447.1 cupin [Desulfuromonas versatilis]
MKLVNLKPEKGFKLVAGTSRSQAATMVLPARNSTGGPDNRHPDSDQWLFVLAGRGQAIVAGSRVDLQPGDLLLIEAGEAHEIINSGDAPLETLTLYAPSMF